ncbi:MAG: hypothetical protein ABR591_01085 [Candidatus Velthaea sp.]
MMEHDHSHAHTHADGITHRHEHGHADHDHRHEHQPAGDSAPESAEHPAAADAGRAPEDGEER